MPVKSDKWIKRMAEQGMIEPFVPTQIREVEEDLPSYMEAQSDAPPPYESQAEASPPPYSEKATQKPFTFKKSKKIISYGLSSYGYDIRCAPEFQIFTNINSVIVDPKEFTAKSLVTVKDSVCIIPPNSFALGHSIEKFRIPRNILTLCVGKSTYARCGIIVNVTPLEPEWTGQITLEFSNTTPLPAKIYANEGVAQILFLESDEECEVSYRDRKGKYQGQMGVTLPTA